VVRFTIPSRREEVGPAVERIIDAVAPAALHQDQIDSLAVAVAEALSHAVVHGNQMHPARSVQVAVTVVPRASARVEVTDSGAGFDAAALADPTHPSRLLLPGGRGIYLMQRLVDRVDFNRAGNRVRLTVERARKRA
jgi:serine/threonine-protein kinase RsbW